MDMFKFAIQMEKDAEALYLDLSTKSKNTGISKLFVMLAEDEAKHRKNIEILQKKMDSSVEKGIAEEIKTVFDDIRKDFKNLELEEDALKDYEKALQIEKKGMDFYKEQFDKAENDNSKKLFEKLMKQESYHYKTVENLIDMVKKPQWWVENAEFNPKGDNYY